ncbi:MAG: hypothetical protein ACJ8AW_54255 [Rhodopila sp.]
MAAATAWMMLACLMRLRLLVAIGNAPCAVDSPAHPISAVLRRSFHYYLWLYGFVGNGASASHI